MNHLKYLRYVLRHKWFVFLAGIKTGAPLWRLLIHDWSKFTPAEWSAYVNKFIAGDKSDAANEAFQLAWAHHQRFNPHHWEYWLRETPTEMPEHFAREMVADWAGAGRAKSGSDWTPLELWDWYDNNWDRIILHPHTMLLVEWLIDELVNGRDGEWY